MIKAVIFDMDGVLTDSEQFHLASYQKIFKDFNIDLKPEEFRDLFGKGANQIMAEKFKQYHIKESSVKFAQIKDMEFRRLISTNIRPLPGVTELIDDISQKLRMCVASSGSKENVFLILSSLNILNRMEFFLSADDVTNTKPDPEIFRKAAVKLNLKPNECIVIEDSDLGIAAAKDAGNTVIAVTTTLPKSRLDKADLIVGSLLDLDYTKIMSMSKIVK